MMRQFGVTVLEESPRDFCIPKEATYEAKEYQIEDVYKRQVYM